MKLTLNWPTSLQKNKKRLYLLEEFYFYNLINISSQKSGPALYQFPKLKQREKSQFCLMPYCMLDPPAACCWNQHNSFQRAANSEETIHKPADKHQEQVQVLQTPVSTKTRFLQLCFCSCSGTVILPTQSRRILFLHAVVTGASVTWTIFRTSPPPAKRNEELETRAQFLHISSPRQPMLCGLQPGDVCRLLFAAHRFEYFVDSSRLWLHHMMAGAKTKM